MRADVQPPTRERPMVTILMPCKEQKEAFLREALESVRAQTSPRWRLIVIIPDDGPRYIADLIDAYRDPRIDRMVTGDRTFAAALNSGIAHADTEYVCILLSDDRLDPRAVEIIAAYVARFPQIDFFHSSRRYIDAAGQVSSDTMLSRSSFDLSHFATRGSPVKHLLCWRRSTGIAIGNMDEAVTEHGCDDFDFPWRMAEAGATFRAIPECLYYYRIHHDSDRLTTRVSVQRQTEVLRAIFSKHDVREPEVSRYIEYALDTYLIRDQMLDYRVAERTRRAASCYREASAELLPSFLSKGYAQRYFFPHRAYVLCKGGPDGLKMAERLSGISDPARLREVVLYGLPATTAEFPEDLFFDDDVQWHQQHFGRVGQVASANLVEDGDRVYGMNYLSDLVQRIARQRAFKTHVENRFKGWVRMLLNAVLNYASDRGLRQFFSPTAKLVMRHADPTRPVQEPLFARIYDTTVLKHFDVEATGDWWRIDVARNADRIVPLAKRVELVDLPKVICVCHDIERGHGHQASDPRFAEAVDRPARVALESMLAVERSLGVRTTYNVLGVFLDEVRAQIEQDGHACAFHSYDHQEPQQRWRFWSRFGHRGAQNPQHAANHGARDQLRDCRGIDYRIKGYRPPGSRITDQLSDARLSWHNFEWLASSAYSFGFETPRMENGLVKIPIQFDDYDLYLGRTSFQEWERRALTAIEERDFVAFGLHDCYAEHWLPHYEGFLRKVRDLGQLKTFDEVAAHVTVLNARWV